MNFLVDESVDQQVVQRLRQDGHDVLYVAEMRSQASATTMSSKQQTSTELFS